MSNNTILLGPNNDQEWIQQETKMKDTFYFQHDYNARNDPKLQRLLMKCGCEGLGIYWCIIEQLYEQGGKLPNNHTETIAFNLHTNKTTVDLVVFELNLFVFDDEFFWSESVLKRLENRTIVSTKRSDAGKKGGAPRGNRNACKSQEINEIHIIEDGKNKQMVECETSKNKQMLEKNKQKQAIKGKERKEKERKENNIERVCIDGKDELSLAHAPKEKSDEILEEADVGDAPPPLTEEQKEKSEKAKKYKYAEFVTLTRDEYAKLCEDYTEEVAKRMIEILDNYKGAKGTKYKSDYRAILNWVVDRYREEFLRYGTKTNGRAAESLSTTAESSYQDTL